MKQTKKHICPRCAKEFEGPLNQKFCTPKHRQEYNLLKYLEKGQVRVVAPQA